MECFGFGREGAVGGVVGKDGHKRSDGWEALSLFLSQRRLSERNAGTRVPLQGQGGVQATHSSADADNRLHR